MKMNSTGSALRTVARKWNLPILAFVAALGLAICCTNAFAQTGASSIEGTVTDSTGSVIVGASVHVVNQATGVASDTKSNGVGFYQVPGLFTGTYVITYTAPNMKTYVQTVDLLVDRNLVIDPVMVPGAVTERVEVTADTVQLADKDNGTLGNTLENGRINELPMNARSLVTLTTETTPGMEGLGGNNSTAQRVNGIMYEGLEYVADGAPLNNLQFGGQDDAYQAILPDPDSIQEAQVQTSNAGARYETPATAVITTKSGTNQLHGSFFETNRDSAIGIARSRSVPYNYAQPEYIRNEFGASAGGPIILPHVYHGKNKSFWFFAYERFSLAQISFQALSVPTPAERGGDFSGDINSGGVLQSIYDPSTTASSATCVNNLGVSSNNTWCRTQFAYNGKPNTMNPALMSPFAKIFYAMAPPETSTNNPLVASNLNALNPNFQVIPTITLRLDHEFNEKNKVFLRYGQNFQKTTNLYGSTNYVTQATGSFPAGASGLAYNTDTNFATALGYTHVFSPNFYAETTLAQQWFVQYSGATPNITNFTSMLGLPNNFGAGGFPGISVPNISGLTGNQNQYQQNSIDSRIQEDLTKNVGKHQFTFGGLYRHERIFYLPSQQSEGVTFANGQTTGLENPNTGTSPAAFASTGIGGADLFLGGGVTYKVQLEPIGQSYRIQMLAGYFQDNWRANRKFTANIGLRYEAHPGQKAANNIVEAPDLKNQAIVLGDPISDLIARGRTTQAIITNMENIGVVFETPAQAGFPSNLFVNTDLLFLPRVGFAYQPFGDKRGLVVRGGYGRYAYQMADRSENPTPTSLPFAYSYTQDYTSAAQTPDSLSNYALRSMQNATNPYSQNNPTGTGMPILGVNASGVVNTNITSTTQKGAILPGSFGPGGVVPDYKPDLVTEANFTLEQALKGQSLVRIGWVFTHGTNLDQVFYPNYTQTVFAWEMNTGTPPPAGAIGTSQYAGTYAGVWNNVTYGNVGIGTKTGFSNDNSLQATYQRLMHHGIAYQVMYVWSRPFRMGGNSSRDAQTVPVASAAYGTAATILPTWGTPTPFSIPPPRPANIPTWGQWHALERYEQYILDSSIPLQHIQFNGIVDVPVGTGKRFLGNSNRFVNEVVGGFQIAGDGQVISQDFNPTNTNWGAISPITRYKHAVPITDCSSGVCHPEFLWFNGYISPKLLPPGNGGTCTTNCITGVPTNYVPYEAPVDNNPALPNFGTNDVQLSSPALLASNGGNPVTQAYAADAFSQFGANYYQHKFINGPMNYNVDLSVYKVFPITERINLRANVDAFNVLNIQGYTNPNGTSGEEAVQPGGNGASSYWAARQLQFTMRLTF